MNNKNLWLLLFVPVAVAINYFYFGESEQALDTSPVNEVSIPEYDDSEQESLERIERQLQGELDKVERRLGNDEPLQARIVEADQLIADTDLILANSSTLQLEPAQMATEETSALSREIEALQQQK